MIFYPIHLNIDPRVQALPPARDGAPGAGGQEHYQEEPAGPGQVSGKHSEKLVSAPGYRDIRGEPLILRGSQNILAQNEMIDRKIGVLNSKKQERMLKFVNSCEFLVSHESQISHFSPVFLISHFSPVFLPKFWQNIHPCC